MFFLCLESKRKHENLFITLVRTKQTYKNHRSWKVIRLITKREKNMTTTTTTKNKC